MSILDKIMKPKSIAVIGASTKEHTIGSDIMKRLQEYKFNGKIYPVNPKGGIIEGLQSYPTVLDVPGEVDLAFIVVNSFYQQLTSVTKKASKVFVSSQPVSKKQAKKALNLKNN